jgi:hypothetical protein
MHRHLGGQPGGACIGIARAQFLGSSLLAYALACTAPSHRLSLRRGR